MGGRDSVRYFVSVQNHPSSSMRKTSTWHEFLHTGRICRISSQLMRWENKHAQREASQANQLKTSEFCHRAVTTLISPFRPVISVYLVYFICLCVSARATKSTIPWFYSIIKKVAPRNNCLFEWLRHFSAFDPLDAFASILTISNCI